MKALSLFKFSMLLVLSEIVSYSGMAQDTLVLKSGKVILCKVLSETTTHIQYKLADTSNHVVYTALQNTIVHDDRHWARKLKKEIKKNSGYGNDSSLLNAGIAGVIASCQPMIYLRYSLGKRLSAMLSGGYILFGLNSQDMVLGIIEPETAHRFSGPDAQIGFSYRVGRGSMARKRTSALNLFYDYRYKIVPKYEWFDGSPGLSSTTVIGRSEHVYSHNLIFTFSQTFKRNTKTNFGWFAGGGPQLEKARIHYLTKETYQVEDYPPNSFETIHRPGMAVRVGVFLSFNAIHIKRNQ